jgi:CubicO group peptidase (beta-lactamase class C family)
MMTCLQRPATTLAVLLLAVACASPVPRPDVAPRSDEVRPRFAAAGPDAEAYQASAGYPKGNRETVFEVPWLVGSHSHLDEIFESRLIRRAPVPSRLVRVAEPPITWRFEGRELSLDDYLARNPTTGLLIAQGDTILVERYQYGRTDRHRFTSWSMAKTVTAMLIGIAIAEGHIRSVDDPAAAYVPALTDTEYGRTSLRHLLQMSSGVRFREDYGGDDDAGRLAAHTFLLRGPGGAGLLASFTERSSAAGTRFSYASSEAQVLGLVIRGATGRTPSEYLQTRVWQPIGAEGDAAWLIDRSGQESTYCCLNAVLRDYARFGLLLAHDGHWRGRHIIPASWVIEATTVAAHQPHLRPGTATPFAGYGYQTWILPGERRMFSLRGIRGQLIFVDPQSRLVMVNTGVHTRFVDLPRLREAGALWWAVVRQLGG